MKNLKDIKIHEDSIDSVKITAPELVDALNNINYNLLRISVAAEIALVFIFGFGIVLIMRL